MLLAVTAALAVTRPAMATILNWDPNMTGAASGGTGTWDTVNLQWFDGAADVAWNNATPDSAVFAGAAGTVSLAGPITAAALSVNSNNYVIDLNGSNLTVNGSTGGSATLGTVTITNTGGTTSTFATGTLSGAGPRLSGNMNVTYTGGAWTPSINHNFTGTLSLVGSGLIRTDGFDLGINSNAALLQLGGSHTLQLGTNGTQSRTYARNIELLGAVAGIQTGGAQTLILSGNISGTGNFVRQGGQGLVILAGNNSFTGKVTSLTGNATIVAASPTAFGAANIDPSLNVVEGGANSNTIGFLGGVDVDGAKNITVGGSVRPDGIGTIQNFGGNNSFAGNITMSNQQMFVVEPNSQLMLKGVLAGSRSLVKQGEGTLVLANSMTYGNTSNGEFRRLTRVVNGKLVFDFSQPTSPQNDIINQSHDTSIGSEASLAGGTLEIKGKDNIDNSQWFQSWRVDIGASAFNIINGAGNNVNVTLRGLTTRAIGGTVDFTLPSGLQLSAVNGFNTSKTNTNGIIGGYATIGRSSWATTGDVGTNAITAYAHTPDEQGASAFDTATNNVELNGTNSNPIADRTVNSLRLANGGTLTLQGTNMVTSGGVLATGNNAATITGGTLEGAASADLVINQFSSATLTIASTISDNTTATALTKSGSGMLSLAGTNNYTGTTFVHAGLLKLDSAGALPANSHLSLRGGVVGLTADFTRAVGTAATGVDWLGSGGFAAYGGDRIVNLGGAGATLNWNNNSAGPTWEAGTAATIATEGMYNAGFFVGTNYRLILGYNDATGTIVFQNGINLSGNSNVPLTRTIEVIDSPNVSTEARMSGVLSGGSFAGLNKTGAGTLELAGANTYNGETIINSGELVVSGSLSANSPVSIDGIGTLRVGGTGKVGGSVKVNFGGTLTGSSTPASGTSVAAVTVNSGGTIAPGVGVGNLSTGSIAFNGGTFALQIASQSSFDQLNVTGAVSLNAPVALSLSVAGALGAGSLLTIIDNDGGDAIAFAGPSSRFVYNGAPLNEGDIFTVSGGFGSQMFQISYAGGTGNDVVLTAVPEPVSSSFLLGGICAALGLPRFRSRRS
jgi:autotransporter-associated beta strand protein